METLQEQNRIVHIQNNIFPEDLIKLLIEWKHDVTVHYDENDTDECKKTCEKTRDKINYIRSLQTGDIMLEEANMYEDVLEFLLRNSLKFKDRLCYRVSKLSSSLYEKLIKYRFTYNSEVIYAAIMNDDLNLFIKVDQVIKYNVHHNEFFYSRVNYIRNIMNNVCFYGAMKILVYIFKHYFPSSEQYIYAIEGERFEIVKYLLKCGCSFNSSVVEYANKKGNLYILRLLLEGNLETWGSLETWENEWNDEILNVNLYNTSHIECMRYAKEKGCNFKSKDSFYEAILNDNVQCVEFLLENDFEYHEDLSLLAMKNNSLNCLRLFKERNLPIHCNLDENNKDDGNNKDDKEKKQISKIVKDKIVKLDIQRQPDWEKWKAIKRRILENSI